MAINIIKLHKELEAAGLPVVSVRSVEPYADYGRPLTPAEDLAAKEIVLNHDGKGEVEAKRLEALGVAGLSPEKIVLILVDKIFNSKEPAQDVLNTLKAEVAP
jgi:hypothetical protein